MQDNRQKGKEKKTRTGVDVVKLEDFENTMQQPSDELAADAFTAALAAVPAEDMWRSWPAERTIMMRMTAKRVKEAVDNLRPPAFVRWKLSFLQDKLNGPAADKLHFILRQLSALKAGCRITTLELPSGGMKDQDVERLSGLLTPFPALAHLNLYNNDIGAAGAERLAGVLGQCEVLTHLNLCNNRIGAGGTVETARFLASHPVLADLAEIFTAMDNDNDSNDIDSAGGLMLRASWRGQASGLVL